MYRCLSGPSRSSQCENWEPNIVWETSSSSSECDFESPTRSRKLTCYPIEKKSVSEEVKQSQKCLKENLDLKKKTLSKQDDNLIKKIHEAAKLHLQNNVDTYVKLRNDEKTKEKSARLQKDEPLWSPRTALAKEAASHTPSKRVKFFASAQQFGLSQALTPRAIRSTYHSVTTPRRYQSPKTSTPKHRDGNIRVLPPNVSPVSAGPLTRRRNMLEEQQKCNSEDSEWSINLDSSNKLSQTSVPALKSPKEKDAPPTKIFIIPDDSWDLTDDSF